MKLQTYHLTRDKKHIKIRELDLTKFEKIGTTGHGLALKYIKGRTIEVFYEDIFDSWYIEAQKNNDNAVKNHYYSYINIDNNKPDTAKNRVRDKRGKPLKKYVKVQDKYTNLKVNTWEFISDIEWKKYREYLKENNIQDYDYHPITKTWFLD